MKERREDRFTPYPWIAFLAVAFLALALLTRPEPVPAPAIAAPNYPEQITVIVIATVTPTLTPAATQTARIEYRAATSTPTIALVLCDAADDGEVCVQRAPTPTNTPLPPPCVETTVTTYLTTVCRKGDGYTSGKQVTQ